MPPLNPGGKGPAHHPHYPKHDETRESIPIALPPPGSAGRDSAPIPAKIIVARHSQVYIIAAITNDHSIHVTAGNLDTQYL